MESGFGFDFSQVRLHDGPEAARSADKLNARAYTAGRHIVFGTGEFRPSTAAGSRLLAHELAHVVQQSAAPGPLRRAPKKQAPSKPKIPQICGRNSRKVAGNWITKVNLDVGANTLTIEWKDPKNVPPGSAGTHKISPGTGKCCLDCDDATTSQTPGSLCTPKDGSWPVFDTACHLSGHADAKNPAFFQRSGVAIHSGNTADPPRSHGCSRTALDVSELIHDNVVVNQTQVEVSGTWSSTKCYKKESDPTPVNRADVCDGDKLKPEKKKKAKSSKAKQAALEGPSEPEEEPEIVLASDERASDGPGPDNSPADLEGLPDPDNVAAVDEEAVSSKSGDLEQ